MAWMGPVASWQASRHGIAVLAWASAVLLIGCQAADDPPTPEDSARSGIEWMIQNTARMPVGWVHPFFQRLYHVVSDPETLARIAEVLRADLESGRHTAFPEVLDADRDLRPVNLSPMLFELERRKQMGLPYLQERDALQALIDQSPGDFWIGLESTQQVVYSVLFEELDLGPRPGLKQLTERARSELLRRPVAELAADMQYMYTITHLIYGRSGYFRRFVRADEFSFAHEPLARVLRAWNAGQRDVRFMDLVAEVLVCHKLMRLPEDDHVRKARRILVEMQNDDGSWGQGRGAARSRVHATLGGVLANLEFADPLRESMPAPNKP
jgi:hypothetical protein